MQNFNAEHLNNQLTDTEFELLLRNRVQRAFNNLPAGVNLIQFIAVTDYSSEKLTSGTWHINVGDATKGEILCDCVIEHNRRTEFVRTNKLLLLEGKAEPEA